AGGRLLVAKALVVELQLDLAAEAQVEIARGEPGGALLRVGEGGPDALPGPREQALGAGGGGLEEGGELFHFLFLGLGCAVDFAFSMASSARSAASSRSRRRVQASRCCCIHTAAASSGFGSSERKWSRPATRRRTRPARSRMRMCLET